MKYTSILSSLGFAALWGASSLMTSCGSVTTSDKIEPEAIVQQYTVINDASDHDLSLRSRFYLDDDDTNLSIDLVGKAGVKMDGKDPVKRDSRDQTDAEKTVGALFILPALVGDSVGYALEDLPFERKAVSHRFTYTDKDGKVTTSKVSSFPPATFNYLDLDVRMYAGKQSVVKIEVPSDTPKGTKIELKITQQYTNDAGETVNKNKSVECSRAKAECLYTPPMDVNMYPGSGSAQLVATKTTKSGNVRTKSVAISSEIPLDFLLPLDTSKPVLEAPQSE